MKKQLKNLTDKQLEKICKKYKHCYKCPLFSPAGCYKDKNTELMPEQFGEKEVEVDE